MKIAYVRVSTAEQNEARQIEALKSYNIEKWYMEKISGKDTNRPKLQEMLDFAREGDTIYIHDFSRLARNTQDLLNMVDSLQAKGIHLVSMKENIDTGTPAGKLMLTMIAAINEFERENLKERQMEGIAIQKELDKTRSPQDKKYKGRKAVVIDDDIFNKAYRRYRNREISKKQLAIELKVSRPTLDKLIKERKDYSLCS